MFNIAKKLGWETFWDSVKFTWDSTFVDALGPSDPIEIKPKSNTGHLCMQERELGGEQSPAGRQRRLGFFLS